MAFRQPTFPPPQRQVPRVQTESPMITHQKIDDSQEWVLFSPTQGRAIGPRTQTTSTAKLSDFGSLNTIAQSVPTEDEGASEAIEEDEELDSLDDGLHAFREPAMHSTSRRHDQSGGSILPAHDGLGTFAASSSPVQAQLWNFEQYNPRKILPGHQRRRSSVQRRLDTVDDEEGTHLEDTRMERIEKWRIEQSKVLLEEIEKETRRRAMSQTVTSVKEKEDESGVLTTHHDDEVTSSPSIRTVLPSEESSPEESESLWQRIRRRVIRDLMGIDDTILSVIFGESLAPDTILPTKPLQSSNLASQSTISSNNSSATGWEKRLLDRLARELGILVHQLSSHPGAFSTYLNPSTMDYAGMPIDNSSTNSSPNALPETSLPSQAPPPQVTNSSQSPTFAPTLRDTRPKTSASEHAARWGIEEPENPTTSVTETDYWEQTPDLTTVFGYLQRRFTSQQRSSSSRPNIATANTPDSLRRVAIIRQHHPLVSRSAKAIDRHNARRSSWAVHQHQYNTVLGAPSLKRAGTSCASLSTKKSRRDASEGSRNYWDLGGSVGSGSGFGGVGAWGEV